MHPARLSHVAFLVRSTSKAAEITDGFGFARGLAERWEGEGTLEIYVGDPKKSGLLLLMEPVQEGAYQRAIQKRGPGLHHIAIDVLDLESYVVQLSESGWLVHPKSLITMKKTRTVYLARPGIPTLIEVQEREKFSEKPLFITRLEVPFPEDKMGMISALGVSELCCSRDEQVWVICDGREFCGTSFHR